jgi:glutamyl-tRNA reductase
VQTLPALVQGLLPAADMVRVEDFARVGIEHHHAPVAVREAIAFTETQQREVLTRWADAGLGDLMLLQTCNRTELYGFQTPEILERLLLEAATQIHGHAPAELTQHLQHKQGAEAMHHLFEVAVGLRSQVLGDLQIVFQVKTAMRLAKESGVVSSALSRLADTVYKAHKLCRTQTEIGAGVASISQLAADTLIEWPKPVAQQRILLLGAGKIARHLSKLLKSEGASQITILNRTAERSRELAAEFGLMHAPLDSLADHLPQMDAVVVTTGAADFVLHLGHRAALPQGRPLLALDLSMPRNIDPALGDVPGLTLFNLDDLQQQRDAAYERRRASLPAVHDIIGRQLAQYIQWLSERPQKAAYGELARRLQELTDCELAYYQGRTDSDKVEFARQVSQRIIQKMVQELAPLLVSQSNDAGKDTAV